MNILQYHPTSGSTYNITSSLIGVTINEKDFMKFYPGFSFQIDYGNNNIESIQLGRTGMYQTSKPITAKIIFPAVNNQNNTFPQSLYLDIIQKD